MSWNRYGDWEESWKNGGQQGGRGWFEHPSDAECTTPFDAYGAWNGPHGGAAGAWQTGDCGNPVQMPSGVGGGSVQGMFGGEHDAQDMMGDQSFEAHHGHHMGAPHHGNGVHMGAAGNGPSPFGHHNTNGHSYHPAAAASQQIYAHNGHGGPPGGGATSNGHGGPGSSNGHAAAASHNSHGGLGHAGNGTASNGRGGDEGEDDRAMMAELEESMRSMMPLNHESSDEDEGPTRPAEATAEEREEAERVVRTAFKEAKERDKLREKVKKASQADLQALLNARLAKR
jgi:hypothetical protein